jgi:membrane-bound ClpP family serine protease
MVDDQPQSANHGAPDWRAPLPEKVPDATYAPALLALGIIFLLFGIVSSYVFSIAGAILMVWSISKWVGELVRGE